MAREPYCPVDADTSAWLNYRWAWLCREFGVKGLKQRPVILPTPEFFPDNYAGTPDDVEALVRRVAGYMEVDADTLEIHYYEEARSTLGSQQSTTGMYRKNEAGKYEIWLEVSHLNDPAGMIATIAHELGHVLLLGQERLSADAADHEPLTDLITVFMGLGAFPANNSLHENYWFEANHGGWTIGKQGYLSMNMFGYAFALLARSRGEDRPVWIKQLRLDVRKACEQSLHCIPSLYDPRMEHLRPVAFPPRHLGSQPITPTSADSEGGRPHDASGRCVYCDQELTEGEPALEEEICADCRNSMDQADAEHELILASNAKVRADASRIVGSIVNWFVILGVMMIVLLLFSRIFFG